MKKQICIKSPMFQRFATVLTLFVWAVLVSVGSVHSQAQSLSETQLRQLQQLTPEQKRQLVRALGGSGLQTSISNEPEPVQATPLPDVALMDPGPQKDDGRFKPGESLIIELSSPDETEVRVEAVKRALGKRVYELDNAGVMEFPGVGPIAIQGLDEDQVELRLLAEPVLTGLAISVFRIPVTPGIERTLRPFGYDLFSNPSASLNSESFAQVPANYILGPGDTLDLALFGQVSAEYRLSVSRDGQINIPEIGPMAVAGMNYEQLREELTQRIEEKYLGVRIALSMGRLRSMQVFVLGDVKQPGLHMVNGLATITSGLYASGGISENGSLRRIQLKRNNRVVGEFDAYELLLKGNTRADRKLQPGDVVYVPPVRNRVSVFGEVTRPAIYELRDESSLEELLRIAGGVLPSAFTQEARVMRFAERGNRSVLTANLDRASAFTVRPGDEVEVQSSLNIVEDAVSLKGHVVRERQLKWRPGFRLLDLIPTSAHFDVQADQQYLLVRRLQTDAGNYVLKSANWRAAKSSPSSSFNLALEPRDEVLVFSLTQDRAEIIRPLIESLDDQATLELPARTVRVNGLVRAPGEYPFEPGMTVSDLIRAAGSLKENAFLESAELSRFTGSGEGEVSHITLSLQDALGGGTENLVLSPYDVLTVKEIPLWGERFSVRLEGEVVFPGIYAISRGERLSSVIRRAGGFTSLAFPDGAVFLREGLKSREREQLEVLRNKARRSVLLGANDGDINSQQRIESLLSQLEATDPLGRLVIDLEGSVDGDSESDILLEDGDQLLVPKQSQEITVIGEVQYPTSHLFSSGLSRDNYIQKSGGTTAEADHKRIYVVRANGNVIAQQGTHWFRGGGALEILPGDTIVVPLDSNQISNLSLWSSVSQVIYNIGVAAAAVASF